MAVNNYDITASAFLTERVAAYELSILTGVDSFAYIIRDRSENRLLAYRSRSLEAHEQADRATALSQLIRTDPKLHGQAYGNCILGWEDYRVTLVPDALFVAGQARSYLEQLAPLGLEDEVRAERYNSLEAHLLFALNTPHLEAVTTSLQPRSVQHPSGGLLEAWGRRSRRLGHQSVSVAFRGGHFFVAAHRNGLLQFFNTFSYTDAREVIYFILLAYRQCGWAPTRVPLYLCGEITADGELYRQLYRFIEDIRFCQYGAPPATGPAFATLPHHLYFELLCLG